MRKSIYLFLLITGLLVNGCQEDKIWYSVTFRNRSQFTMHDGKAQGWQGVMFGGANPGTGGATSGGLVNPVPDEITIVWKSAIKGKEKEAEDHRAKVNAMAQQYLEESLKDDTIPYPEYESYPSDLFESHKVVLVLKGKVPKKPKNGEIVITYIDDENFDIKHIERSKNSANK